MKSYITECGYCKTLLRLLKDDTQGMDVFCNNKCLADHKKETHTIVKILSDTKEGE